MFYIDVDTRKLREGGNDIKQEMNNYQENIQGFYDRLQAVPTKTYEWVGESANRFVARELLNKKEYEEYGRSINDLGQAMIDYADAVEYAVSKTRKG